MKKITILVIVLLFSLLALYYFLPKYSKYSLPTPTVPQSKEKKDQIIQSVKKHASKLQEYAQSKNFSKNYCFLIDMSLHSGRKRFFVFDLKTDSIIIKGLVAHGSCGSDFLDEAKFSNTPNSGCSSTGMYQVSYKYSGRFGKAYKLIGLDHTNSNAFKRAVVLHAYDCVPDDETYPFSICNSLGCPMISYAFLEKISQYIDKSPRPVLLWIYK